MMSNRRPNQTNKRIGLFRFASGPSWVATSSDAVERFRDDAVAAL
jgi:hypothetical protein